MKVPNKKGRGTDTRKNEDCDLKAGGDSNPTGRLTRKGPDWERSKFPTAGPRGGKEDRGLCGTRKWQVTGEHREYPPHEKSEKNQTKYQPIHK